MEIIDLHAISNDSSKKGEIGKAIIYKVRDEVFMPNSSTRKLFYPIFLNPWEQTDV
jgi:hypothetical protein